MKGRYKVIVEDYNKKSVGNIVSSHNTLTNARKSAYAEIGKYNNRQVSIYDSEKKSPLGAFTLMGEVHKWYSGERYWYPSKDGHYASAGKYPLYANGRIGKKLR